MTLTFRVLTKEGQIHQFNNKPYRVVKVTKAKQGWKVDVEKVRKK